jgi:GcrA cell cycle regulator
MHSRAARLLADLAPGACRWPIGDPRDEGFRWCGKRAEPLHPYCGEHRQTALAPRILKPTGAC